MSRIFGLDLLRCVAVLMVLVAHTRFFLRPLFPSAQGLSIFGFLGVELFFVLSGFLIGGIALRVFPENAGFHELKSFWVRRWFRTLPNYYLFLALNLLLAAWLGGVVSSVASYAVFLQNLASPAPVFFNESWSLAVEEWFYLLFPLLAVVLSRLGLGMRRALPTALVLLFATSTVARVLAVSSGPLTWDDGVRKVVLYRMDALMVGVVGAYLSQHNASFWRRLQWPGFVAGLLLFAAVFWAYFALDRNASFAARTVLFPVTSLSVFFFLPLLAAWQEAAGGLATAVRHVSLWSYSLYLTHLPVRQVLIAFLGDPEASNATWSAASILGITVLFVGLSIGSAALVYRFFERPTTALRERVAS